MSAWKAKGAISICWVGLIALACERPNVDRNRLEGGPAPEPTGIIEGTVFYNGPRPFCLRDEEGKPYAIPGKVILLLFRYDNPPPPSGSAATAENFLVLPGTSLFSLSDCATPGSPEDAVPIARSAGFSWPLVRLGRTYQMRGFYDNDGGFIPFFSVRNLGSAGDVGGGAFASLTASPPRYLPIALPPVEEAPKGAIVRGIAVTLGAIIRTERPVFQVDPNSKALSSEATVPLIADAIQREDALIALANLRLHLVRHPDTMDFYGPNPFGRALKAAGISFDFRPRAHGLPILPVDADLDGRQDLHPILGSTGVPWYFPVIILRRAKSPIEARIGIPDVLLIASIRPTLPLGVRQGFVPKETLASVEVLIPPIAVVVTNPALPSVCRIPYIAPGNIAELYEGSPRECQELPTGNYDINLLSGMAGGRVIDVYGECMGSCTSRGEDHSTCQASCGVLTALRTETGYVFEGGTFSSQAWSIPNELGCPDVAYRPTALNQLDRRRPDGSLPSCDESELLLKSQGRIGGFAVADPDGENAPDPNDTSDGHGLPACQQALRTTGPMAGRVTAINYTAPPPECCEPIRAFCGLPLCPLRDSSEIPDYPEAVRPTADGSRKTREIRIPEVDYRIRPDGKIEALCVPFLMPAACCRSEPAP
ncbi:MAG: hypothetical protein NZM37_08600 [Sandaracinaceae bacterium]|nr:hypothetical protein [Sandaracinaceae bacterium]